MAVLDVRVVDGGEGEGEGACALALVEVLHELRVFGHQRDVNPFAVCASIAIAMTMAAMLCSALPQHQSTSTNQR